MSSITSIHTFDIVIACFVIYFCIFDVGLITCVGAVTTPGAHTTVYDGFETTASTEDTIHFTPPFMTSSSPGHLGDHGNDSASKPEVFSTMMKQTTSYDITTLDGYMVTKGTTHATTPVYEETVADHTSDGDVVVGVTNGIVPETYTNLNVFFSMFRSTEDDTVFDRQTTESSPGVDDPLAMIDGPEDDTQLEEFIDAPALDDVPTLELPTTVMPVYSHPISTTLRSSASQSLGLGTSVELNSTSTSAIAGTPFPSLPKGTVNMASTVGLQHHQLNSLLDSVLEGYDRRILPRSNQVRAVTIYADFVPHSIIEFDTQKQRFSVTGYFKMEWRDEFLTWDPTVYEDTKYLRIPVKSIWIPKLFIDKSYGGKGQVGDQRSDIALIYYRGFVQWYPEGRYSVVCKVNIRFYPYDIQNCTFSYYIADEDNSTINLKHYGAVDLSEYIENAEWKLNSLKATREQIDDKFIVKYQFNVERRGGFAMFTLVVPVLMLSMLSGATFLIPIETGEKCSFSVTVFLAYGIFETVVIDTLPHNSMDVSYFILYLTSLLIVSVLLTFYTILQAKIFDAIGDRKFRFCLGIKQGDGITWGTFLRKIDTYMFLLFLIFVLVLTSIFIAAMRGKLD